MKSSLFWASLLIDGTIYSRYAQFPISKRTCFVVLDLRQDLDISFNSCQKSNENLCENPMVFLKALWEPHGVCKNPLVASQANYFVFLVWSLIYYIIRPRKSLLLNVWYYRLYYVWYFYVLLLLWHFFLISDRRFLPNYIWVRTYMGDIFYLLINPFRLLRDEKLFNLIVINECYSLTERMVFTLLMYQ